MCGLSKVAQRSVDACLSIVHVVVVVGFDVKLVANETSMASGVASSIDAGKTRATRKGILRLRLD